MEYLKTPLNQKCLDQGARLVPFAGWEMPVQFAGLMNEHNAVRKNAGLFDVSHMGVISIKGLNAKDEIQKLVPTDLYRIGTGEACYTVLLNDHGGIIDDLIIYDLGIDGENQDCLMLIINAACKESDINWFKKNLNLDKITVNNAKKDPVLLALQGPKAEHYLIKILGDVVHKSLKDLPPFGHKTINYQFKDMEESASLFIARTGYTGEKGYEILLESEPGNILWDELINAGVTPCGLGARDTLRLEAAMHLFGNDINENTTPLEAGLGWLVHLEMPKKFIGREALEKQSQHGLTKKLVGLEIQGRAIARKDYPIFYNNQKISQITSGSWSPTLEKPIALAYLPKELTKLGDEVNVQIRDKLYPAMVVKKPFYRSVS
ncbi:MULTISPECIES: glycine cleavage system aminomethyltransferase GcvT [Prochlorococcus]|uniref:glycine cleavage system aminomethyltransferase GcvT n=1 Tax=Prochlorococcus TaxID=1218 RepID=UPI000533961D|nr:MULTISPECIES: glycine cleavage system aminomethyltransferase GcvT [Prochlorococcus]KGG13722.1 Aminomethyltransferase (glycine cleavage system T protein) [Prochlorococcus sp. MIT 0601]